MSHLKEGGQSAFLIGFNHAVYTTAYLDTATKPHRHRFAVTRSGATLTFPSEE